MPNDKPQTLVIRFDGDDVRPESLSTVQALGFVAAYLDLVVGVTSTAQVEVLNLHGLEIVPKCAEIRIETDAIGIAMQSALIANELIEGRRAPEHGWRGPTENARQRLRELPAFYRCSTLVGEIEHQLVAPAELEKIERWEVTTMRATPIKVGGKLPKVQFAADEFESSGFSVDASKEQAQQLGARLYEEFEVELELARNSLGLIRAGKILKVTPVSDGEPLDEWKNWFSKAGQGWDDVEDVEGELGRYEGDETP